MKKKKKKDLNRRFKIAKANLDAAMQPNSYTDDDGALSLMLSRIFGVVLIIAGIIFIIYCKQLVDSAPATKIISKNIWLILYYITGLFIIFAGILIFNAHRIYDYMDEKDERKKRNN